MQTCRLPRFSALMIGALLGSCPTHAQLLVNTVAGGKTRSGVPAQDVVIRASGITRDPSGNLVISSGGQVSGSNVIQRIRKDGIIETIAGTGVSGFGGDGGPAANAPLNGPGAVQYDAVGNLYIADVNNFRIRRIDPSGTITTIVGTGIEGSLGADGPATTAQIETVTSIAIDQDGNVYFAERILQASGTWGRVRRLTTDGRLELVAGAPPPPTVGVLFGPGAGDGGPAAAATIGVFGISGISIAVDNAGDLYLTDYGHIRRITPDGIINKFAGYAPEVTGANNGDGGPAMNSTTYTAWSLTLDPSGALYFLDAPGFGTGVTVIRRISPDGTISTVAGGGKSADDGPAAQVSLNGFSLVSSNGPLLVGDGEGAVYFVQGFRARVLQTAQATIQTIAGAAPKAAPDGMPATDAWLLTPTALALNRSGDMYIFDSSNCSIRKVGSDGLLSTVGGTGKCGNAVPSGAAGSTDLPQTAQLAVDSQGRIYGAGYGSADFVYAIATDGTVSPVVGSVMSPLIANDSKDRLYVASGNGGTTIRRITPGAATESLSWAQVVGDRIFALGVDTNDNLYVMGDTRIFHFDQSGNAAIIGRAPPFALPNVHASLAIDAAGDVWCSDVLSMYKLITGPILTAFGQHSGFSGDGGPAVAAFFSIPGSLRFDSDGNLYLLDSGNSRVRKISGSAPKNPPAISQGGVVNAASLAGGPVAPGELISIFGKNFGPSGLLINAPQNNSVPGVLGSTRVLGLFAITAATASQINGFVPNGITGTSVTLIVDVDGVQSAPITVPLAPSAPGLASADASGTGQGAILNQDGSYNSRANPAARGSVVSLFGTGEGAVSPALPDGALVISTPFPTPVVSPINVTIGGQKAEVLYAGSAPSLPVGVFQLNVRIPTGVTSGDAPVSVTVGSSTTPRQVTLAVQ